MAPPWRALRGLPLWRGFLLSVQGARITSSPPNPVAVLRSCQCCFCFLSPPHRSVSLLFTLRCLGGLVTGLVLAFWTSQQPIPWPCPQGCCLPFLPQQSKVHHRLPFSLLAFLGNCVGSSVINRLYFWLVPFRHVILWDRNDLWRGHKAHSPPPN